MATTAPSRITKAQVLERLEQVRGLARLYRRYAEHYEGDATRQERLGLIDDARASARTTEFYRVTADALDKIAEGRGDWYDALTAAQHEADARRKA